MESSHVVPKPHSKPPTPAYNATLLEENVTLSTLNIATLHGNTRQASKHTSGDG